MMPPPHNTEEQIIEHVWHQDDRLPDALFADFYELTMMQAYLQEGMTAPAAFSLFVRRLPTSRNYLIACGLETVLQDIERLRFSRDDIAYLATLGSFAPDFLDWLGRFRFTGNIFAMAEGTPVFANEPILEVIAPLPEAQFLETMIMNQVHLQTLMASKAARAVSSARGRKVIDFGARRMHGMDAANKAARAFYIAGVIATSNTAAGRQFGIPVTGTMGHSYIQAHDDEHAAFQAFADVFPGTVLLVDTYETIAATRKVIDLAKDKDAPISVSAVRLDSGDLLKLSREVRTMLDAAGLPSVEIIASGGLDDVDIETLVAAGAPIDGFGVGTNMGVSADAPALDIAYKLTEYNGVGRMKLSNGKATLPGRKQVFRQKSAGLYTHDIIARAGETLPGSPLLECVMRDGARVMGTTSQLENIRIRTRENLACLPRGLLTLTPAVPAFPVHISAALGSYEKQVRHRICKDSRTGTVTE
jgi:nicotinate phosphoribosyltransferase